MTIPGERTELTPRQRDLIAVASRLFAARGYHAVGINDLSAELGLTGPAFYRHFKSKDEVLVAVLDEAITGHLESVRDVVASVYEPAERLEAIVRHHVAFVFDRYDAIRVWRNEYAALSEADRHRLRYLQRLYTEEWVRALAALRPGLGRDEVQALCQAGIGAAQSPTVFRTRVDRAALEPLLSRAVLHMLVSADV